MKFQKEKGPRTTFQPFFEVKWFETIFGGEALPHWNFAYNKKTVEIMGKQNPYI